MRVGFPKRGRGESIPEEKERYTPLNKGTGGKVREMERLLAKNLREGRILHKSRKKPKWLKGGE